MDNLVIIYIDGKLYEFERPSEEESTEFEKEVWNEDDIFGQDYQTAEDWIRT